MLFLLRDDGVGRCGTMTESVVLVELDCLFFKWPKQLNAHHEVVDIEIANIIEHEKTRQQKKELAKRMVRKGHVLDLFAYALDK
ncbi:hypothetical protein Tco_0640460, partial [Tanacetum coccineum]